MLKRIFKKFFKEKEEKPIITDVRHEGKSMTIYPGIAPDICPTCQGPLILYYLGGTGDGGECTTKYYVVSCPDHPLEGWVHTTYNAGDEDGDIWRPRK